MGTVFHVDFKNKKLVDKVADISLDATPKIIVADLPKINKKEYFEDLMNTGLVQVLVNPKMRGVKLPPSLKSEAIVALNWSYKFNIKDFSFDDKGIRGTLSFNSKEFFVDTPWKSIWGIFLTKTPKESMKIWEADAPKEISLSEFIQEDK